METIRTGTKEEKDSFLMQEAVELTRAVKNSSQPRKGILLEAIECLTERKLDDVRLRLARMEQIAKGVVDMGADSAILNHINGVRRLSGFPV